VDTPQFHVKDASCGENDPNGPSFDPVHGVYHLHYQNHVGLHGGRTYGHAVSKDLTHWAHMPISIWNDQYYDSTAIYTGSATIVDGKVVQVYPGLCKTGVDGCPGGTNLCIAKPADTMDQLQTNWTKTAWFKGTNASNPIVRLLAIPSHPPNSHERPTSFPGTLMPLSHIRCVGSSV
jgi:sucrose-6-phosphate hydrolase SacC (GH32 family)